MASRRVVSVVASKWQSEGRGAKVRRTVGGRNVDSVDPFLLLDEFEGNSSEGQGFPDHPHRGIETLSYLLQGEFVHEDFKGHRGTLKAGDMQLMCAGRGIVHSEMPGRVLSKGLQLWINLRAKDKMMEPRYFEISAKDIPQAERDGVSVKVLSGEALGVSAPIRTQVPIHYFDFHLRPKARLAQPIPDGWAVFAYVLEGAVKFGSEKQEVEAHQLAIFSQENGQVEVANESDSESRFVLIAGEPIKEPVARHGPFVMNTQEQIAETFRDYSLGRNGFEGAVNWQSVEGNK